MIDYSHMKKSVIIVMGVEDTEFSCPYYRLLEAGFAVDVAAKGKKNAPGKWDLPIPTTVDAESIRGTCYDLVVVSSGYEFPDRVRQMANRLEFLRAFESKKKIIPSVWHGPWVFISAGIVRGRRMTCYPGCKDDLINAGALYEDVPVVAGVNLVMVPHFRNNPEWLKATLAACSASFE